MTLDSCSAPTLAMTPSGTSSRFLDTQEAAGHLGLSVSWLNQLRHRGGGPRYYRLGRSIRYLHEDLQAWASTQCFVSTADYQLRRGER